MLLVECNPLVCPAGDRCLNQAFEKRAYPPLIPYKTDNRGWGLKTLVDVKKGKTVVVSRNFLTLNYVNLHRMKKFFFFLFVKNSFQKFIFIFR